MEDHRIVELLGGPHQAVFFEQATLSQEPQIGFDAAAKGEVVLAGLRKLFAREPLARQR